MNRLLPLLVFFGLFATYASMTPGAIAGMGYTGEEMNAGDSLLDAGQAIISGRSIPPIKWSRHGPVPVILDLPFLALGRGMISEDFALSFSPVLLTALLVSVLFAWLRKLTSPGRAFLLAMAGGFGTMLWPYAFIGLETKQSLFAILAGYLVFECDPVRSYSRALLLGICCALAVSVKSTGVVLFPAIAYLVYREFHEDWRRRIRFAAVTAGVIVLVWVLSAAGRERFWVALGGSLKYVRPLLIDSVFLYFTNLIGMFGSPAKGLFVYAPPLLLSIYAIPRAWRAHRDVTAFALLAAGGVCCGFAMFRYFADEVWGPRYMHSCVAPLLLIIGAGRARFSPRRDALLLPLLAMGAAISFFGAIYYYGVRHGAATRTDQNSAQQLMSDPVLNEVRFNARLFGVWLSHPAAPVLWPPPRLWMYARPAGLPPRKTVDLRELARPQALLIRLWGIRRTGRLTVVYDLLLAAAAVGPLLLAAAAFLVIAQRSRWADPPPRSP